MLLLLLAPQNLRVRLGARSIHPITGSDGRPRQDLHRPDREGLQSPGYHFGPEDLTLATRIIEEFVERALRFYAQDPVERLAASSRLGLYVWRWRSGGGTAAFMPPGRA